MPNPSNNPVEPLSVSGPGFTMAYAQQQNRENYTDIFVLDQNFTRIYGKHEIQFGGRYHQEYLHSLPDQSSGGPTFSSNFTAQFNPASGSAYSALAQHRLQRGQHVSGRRRQLHRRSVVSRLYAARS